MRLRMMSGRISPGRGGLFVADPCWVLFDTNAVGRIKRYLDPSLSLVSLLVMAFDGKGMVSHFQLNDMHGFEAVRGELEDLPALDEKSAAFLLGYRGKVDIQKVYGGDPRDINFVVFALENRNSVFVTCERALLQIAEEQGITKACLKAAVHRAHAECTIFGDASFKTEVMFDPSGTDPFLHYRKSTRCPQCDPRKNCRTQEEPPRPA